jgi:hypothetical protein
MCVCWLLLVLKVRALLQRPIAPQATAIGYACGLLTSLRPLLLQLMALRSCSVRHFPSGSAHSDMITLRLTPQ